MSENPSNGASGPVVETYDSVFNPPTPEPEEPTTPDNAADSGTGDGDEGQHGGENDAPDTSAGEKEAGLSDVEKAKLGTPKGVQKRLDKLTAQNREHERQLAVLAEENARLKAGSQISPVPTLASGAPDPNGYPAGRYDPDYQEALAGFKAQQAVREYQAQQAKQSELSKIDALEDKARATHSDYDDVISGFVESDLARNPVVLGVLKDSDVPTELAYYLGTNPEVAESLKGLSAARVAAKLVQIEDSLLGSEAGEKPAPAKPQSKAPPPPARLKGGAAIADPLGFEGAHVDSSVIEARVAATRKKFAEQGRRSPY